MAEKENDEGKYELLTASLKGRIPELSDELAVMTANKLVSLAITAVTQTDVIKKNTLNKEGIKAFSAESNEKEIVAARTEYEKSVKEVEKLTEQLEKAKAVQDEKEENLVSVAKSAMAATISTEKADSANETLKTTRDSVRTWIKALTDSVPETEEITEFLSLIREQVFGPDSITPAIPDGDSTSGKKSESALIREWAKNNGYDVKPKGKIPDEIQIAYYKAHPSTE